MAFIGTTKVSNSTSFKKIREPVSVALKNKYDTQPKWKQKKNKNPFKENDFDFESAMSGKKWAKKPAA